jgi:hypothetical protein
LPPTFLRELGMPRPSAVEHYLEQPYYPGQRPSDRASLATYGDATGYDLPGKLAGRKFYLDREDAYAGEPWKDESEANRLNDRSTLALEASRPGRCFRFTVRFRDLDPAELAAVLVALCPHQYRATLAVPTRPATARSSVTPARSDGAVYESRPGRSCCSTRWRKSQRSVPSAVYPNGSANTTCGRPRFNRGSPSIGATIRMLLTTRAGKTVISTRIIRGCALSTAALVATPDGAADERPPCPDCRPDRCATRC